MKQLLSHQNEVVQSLRVVGAFHDSYAALEFARREPVDLAFLDIDMPEIDGLELAERLIQIHSHIQVVFVTAYHDHAIEAFEINALDYILKPVQSVRLAKTLQRLSGISTSRVAEEEHTGQPMLCCMQRLHYLDVRGSVQYFNWRTQKAQELFAYLIYHRNRTVSKQTLLDLLWPEYDEEKASTQLHTAIYQIRKVIKETGLDLMIKYMDEGYRLVWGEGLKLDVEEWEKGMLQAPEVTPATIAQHLDLLELYRGDYLEEHRYSWSQFEQERIRNIWLEHASTIADCYVMRKKYIEALRLYTKRQEQQPYLEAGYFGMMKIHAILGHHVEVVKQFELLSSKIREEFDVEPDKEVVEWYRKWKERYNINPVV